MLASSCALRARRSVATALAVALCIPLATSAATPRPPPKTACGKKRTAMPATRLDGSRPPLVIGDSVMYQAVDGLARLGFEANSVVCRRMDQGIAVLRSRARRGLLPRVVVLQLGANGRVRGAQIDEALSLLGREGSLLLVTPTDVERPRGIDAVVMRAAAVRHGGRVAVLEWAALAASHPEWMARDRVHIRTSAGVESLIALIAHGTGVVHSPVTVGGVPAIPG